MNKKDMTQVRLIGKEIRERFWLSLAGLLLMVGSFFELYFGWGIDPEGFLEGIGFLVSGIVLLFLFFVGWFLVYIALTDEGFNTEDKK